MAMADTYERIKEHIGGKLKARQNQLNEGDIGTEVSNTRALIHTIGLDTFARFLPDNSPLTDLSDTDWTRMERELEGHFNVRMTEGVILKGSEQQYRDTTWWSNKARIQGENFYWNRYESYIRGKLPPKVVATIDLDTDLVMNNIGDPSISSFDIKGMVVGHVQSGKTGNYAGLVCKAADAGYKFIVVIAGGTNNLRDQTQHRLNEAFVGLDKGQQVGAGVGNSPSDKMPICLTTSDKDFNKQDADKISQGLNFHVITSPVLIVIKKNVSALKNVITWLNNQYKNQIPDHSMLIIDDESDYASINTNDADNDPTQINKRIRELITLFKKGSYVAYTATPYANIFIDHEATSETLGNDLFPKDFIFALDAPSNYFGARRIFIETDDHHLITIPEMDLEILPLNHKKETELGLLPESMYEAIRLFIINVAIRSIRGQGRNHNSMLIHASRFTNLHEQIAIIINDYQRQLESDFSNFGMLDTPESQSSHIKATKDTFLAHVQPLTDQESWPNVVRAIAEIIPTVAVKEVHQNSKRKPEYRSDIAANVIVVGGASLSRGFTLEGLSVSYFMRSTVFYDTLMQMGRWFGYRDGYEDLCRIYLPEKVIDYFQTIIEATEELISDLKIMADSNRTPYDFGLAVKQHPDSALQITARNKQRNVYEFYIDMKLDGHLKETAYLPSKQVDRDRNFAVLKTILSELGDDFVKVGKTCIWKNQSKEMVAEFLKSYKVFSRDSLGLTTRMPIDFIKKYVAEREDRWDIALYSGEGKVFPEDNPIIRREIRQVTLKDGGYEVKNRQVSSGTSESVTLSDSQREHVGNNRAAARALLPRPLLMLHVLQTGDDGDFVAFGVSFPGQSSDSSQPVRVKINTVYYKDLLNQIEPEDEEAI